MWGDKDMHHQAGEAWRAGETWKHADVWREARKETDGRETKRQIDGITS